MSPEKMQLLVSLCCQLCLTALAQQANGGWLDPFDMINYDSSSKTMKNPESQTPDSADPKQKTNQAVLLQCNKQVTDLLEQIEELKNQIKTISQQPSCNPVFKRFLNRLLKEVQRFGGPSQSEDGKYDASIKLSKQAIAEIQSLLNGEDRGKNGALDNALSQILVDLKPHDFEAWTWRFEHSFGVELDTVIKIGVFILIVTAIISTELWSTISWFLQCKRMFVICFFVSIIWNWFYLYKSAFAEHKSTLIKMDKEYEQCTGLKKITWSDSLKEWYRSTWTLQDDPCKKYHEVIIVNPILLVPPMKAITMTITTFITDPLKHIGQGISEFLRALLKDMPITLQIPVLIVITLSILVVMYGSVQAIFQHGILAPFRRPQRERPHPVIEPPPPNPRRVEDRANDDARVQPAIESVQRNRADNVRLERNNIHHRQRPIVVETLRSARTEVDSHQREDVPEEEKTSSETSEPETQQSDNAASGDNANTVQSRSEINKSELEAPKSPQLKNFSGENSSRDDAAAGSQAEERQPGVQEVQDAGTPGDEAATSSLLREIESVGSPVQETRPTDGL